LGWKVERIDKATGRPKGYADPQGTGHGKYPHINIRRPDGKQIRIHITIQYQKINWIRLKIMR